MLWCKGIEARMLRTRNDQPTLWESILPEELLRQFIVAWPTYEAMVRRIPRRRGYAEEPAHTYRPGRVVRR